MLKLDQKQKNYNLFTTGVIKLGQSINQKISVNTFSMI